MRYYHTGGPDFSGQHAGGYNVLFAEGHVGWFGKLVQEKLTPAVGGEQYPSAGLAEKVVTGH